MTYKFLFELFGYKTLELKTIKDIKEMGINNILLDFTIEDYNEVLFVIENYINSIEGRIFIRDIENATYGHYKEEIE